MTIVRKDSALWKKLSKGQFGGKVLVGIQEGEGGDGDATTAQIAAWLHDGTSTIVARPFLSTPLDGRRKEVQEIVARVLRGFTAEKISSQQALALLGMWGRNEVLQFINNRAYAPNAPATIARKGSSTPLVNFGQLKSSISYVVESED